MNINEIDKIDLEYLKIEDYEVIKELMQTSYPNMPGAYWKEHHIQTLLNKFPDGQVVIKVNGEIAGCALSIIVNYNKFEGGHTYKEVTDNYTFNTHDSNGDELYGIDVFIKPNYNSTIEL